MKRSDRVMAFMLPFLIGAIGAYDMGWFSPNRVFGIVELMFAAVLFAIWLRSLFAAPPPEREE